MSSPFGAAHSLSAIIIDPHIAKAIWAIVLAIACALVTIIADIVKVRSLAAERRQRRHPPPS